MKYIIYKIVVGDYIYVGSTKNYTKRKCDHKFHTNSKTNRTLYNKINELGGWEESFMTPIEEVECDSKIQALIKEEFYRKDLKATLNMHSCYNTIEDNRKQRKEYRNINRERISQNKIEYSNLHREEKSIRSKTYRDSHVEELKQKHKIYHELNKQKILSKNNEVIECECGKTYTRANKARHLKTHKS